MLEPFVGRRVGTVPSPGRKEQRLTPRQREVIRLIAEGKSAKEIASILGISTKTNDWDELFAENDEIGASAEALDSA